MPLTAKSRASGVSGLAGGHAPSAESTAALSTVSAMRSVMPRPMAAGTSSVSCPPAMSGRASSGCKNGAAGISQNPSAHVSSRTMPMPMGRASFFCRT